MSRWNSDSVSARILRLVSLISLGIVVLILIFLIKESVPAISSLGSRLVTDDNWNPTEFAREGKFGIVPLVVGTLLITFGAVIVAAPLAILSALFCQYVAPKSCAFFYRRMIELLAGIPSVVYGFWGLVVLAPLIARWQPPGPSLLAGIIIVALMIIPTITLVVTETFASVPNQYMKAAVASGVGRWAFIRSIVLPYSRNGIATGVLLGGARAIGETMAVVMVCGNIVKVPTSLFDPMQSLTANIAFEMGYALGDHRGTLFFSGLLLLLMCVVFVALIEILGRFGRKRVAV